MPSLESTIRRAAPVSVVCSELVILLELWRMTGYDRSQRPEGAFFRRAIWDAARVASEEGWSWMMLPGDGIWDDATVQDAARCGVDVFAPE